MVISFENLKAGFLKKAKLSAWTYLPGYEYMMSLFLLIFFWCFMNPQGINAQTERVSQFPQESSGTLSFSTDVCQYQAPEGMTRVEVLYSLPLSQLISQQPRNDTTILVVNVRITGPDSAALASIREKKTISLNRVQNLQNGYNFIDIKRFNLKPGMVHLQISVSDSVTRREGFLAAGFEVKHFPEQLNLSDLYLISGIQKTTEKNDFVKNGLLMVPVPSHRFWSGEQQKNGYVYYEINNMPFQADQTTYYETNFAVSDLAGNEIVRKSHNAIRKNSSNSARIEIIPISELKTGIYKFTVTLTDLEYENSISKSAYFSIVSDSSSNHMVLPMTEADIKNYYDQIKYIATNAEKKIFIELDPEGKQEFLLKFWKSKDPDPATPQNEFMVEHFRRIAYCKQNFPGGINSDMGRIYIKYGPPFQITRKASPVASSKGSEIWTYSLNGTTEFVFVDRVGDGHYVLVDSTSPDEIHNPNWEDDVMRSYPESNKPYLNN